MSTPRRLRQSLTFVGFGALGLISWLQTSAMSRWLGDRLALSARELAEPVGQVARFGDWSRRPASGSAVTPQTPVPSNTVQPRPEPPPPAAYSMDPYRVSDCLGPARLAILLAADDADASVAVLSVPTQSGATRWETLRQGDTRGDWRVWRIGRDRVWFHGKEQACQLRMFDAPLAQAPTLGSLGAESPARSELASHVHKLSDTEYRVARALVDRVLQDPSRWLQVRAVPESPGLRLQRIAPGSLLAVLGLRDGDRLDAVNGFSLGDAEAMMLAFARLRTERHLVVRLQRGGKEVDLDIHVV